MKMDFQKCPIWSGNLINYKLFILGAGNGSKLILIAKKCKKTHRSLVEINFNYSIVSFSTGFSCCFFNKIIFILTKSALPCKILQNVKFEQISQHFGKKNLKSSKTQAKIIEYVFPKKIFVYGWQMIQFDKKMVCWQQISL